MAINGKAQMVLELEEKKEREKRKTQIIGIFLKYKEQYHFKDFIQEMNNILLIDA